MCVYVLKCICLRLHVCYCGHNCGRLSRLWAPALWAVMKLNHAVSVSCLKGLSHSTFCPLSRGSLFTIMTMHGECVQCFVSCALIFSLFQLSCSLFLSTLFSLYMCLFSVSWVFLCFTNSFRNPNLNASCCGFLQKLSMCLLSQSNPASGSYHDGMQICTDTCTTHTATCSTSKKTFCSSQFPSNDVTQPVIWSCCVERNCWWCLTFVCFV